METGPQKNALQSETVKASIFKTSEGEAIYMKAYDSVLEQWPIPYESIDVPTSYGVTHMNVCGVQDSMPLVLLSGQFASSTMWFANVANLSRKYRVYALDIMGDPGKSLPSRAIDSKDDFIHWLVEVYEQLGIRKAHIGGLSYGGWIALSFAHAMPQRTASLVMLDPAASIVPLSAKFFIRMILPFFVAPTRKNLLNFFNWMSHGRPVNKAWGNLMLTGIEHYKFGKRVRATVLADDALRRLEMPVLLLLGEDSVIYNPNKVIAKARKLIPNVSAEIIASAAHNLNMEQPAVVDRKIIDFLDAIR